MGVFDFVKKGENLQQAANRVAGGDRAASAASSGQAAQQMSDKCACFAQELNGLVSLPLRKFIMNCLDNAPDYFFEMGASSTGKYHPAYTLGRGGLVRHTKAACRIAESLLRLEMYQALDKRRDEIIAALIMHDSIKKGRDGSAYTTTDHPLQAAQYVMDMAAEYRDAGGDLDMGQIEFIAELIKSHMGQWNTDFDGNAILPKPITPAQQFVHLCDYLASRKFITITEEWGAPLQ